MMHVEQVNYGDESIPDVGVVDFARHSALALSDVPGKGRGVIAKAAIAAGALLEVAPVIPIRSDNALAERNEAYDYTFAWEVAPYDEAIVLGMISLFNHSFKPNCRLERDYENAVMRAFATRDIAPGEEITHQYQCPLWFDYVE